MTHYFTLTCQNNETCTKRAFDRWHLRCIVSIKAGRYCLPFKIWYIIVGHPVQPLNGSTHQETLYKKVVKRGEYHKFVRQWKTAEVFSKVCELNYRIKVEGSRKIITAHHNRLKPRLVQTGAVEADVPENAEVEVTRPDPQAQTEDNGALPGDEASA